MNSLSYILINIFETLFRLIPIPCKTGLIKIGHPDENSPVLLTCNFHLTVNRVKKTLKNQDCYVLVANSKGINVWCAASGGHFTNHDVISILKTSGIENIVKHRNVIMPQLAAAGIESFIILNKTGWKIIWGPVDAKDIPNFINNKFKKTREMRTIKFPLQHRIEMAACWAFLTSILITLVMLPFSRDYTVSLLIIVWSLSILIFLLYPLYSKWLNASTPGLFSFSRGGIQLLFWGLFLICMFLYSTLFSDFNWGFFIRWSIISLIIILLLSFDLVGSTPTFKSGLYEDRLLSIAIDEEKCQGIATCIEVCPRDCYELDNKRRIITTPRDKQCVQCAACIVQCPFDALYFKAPSGKIITPESIRKYKLNMLGKRFVEQKN